MSLETDIHEMRPVLDRAMADATDAVSMPRVAAVHDGWSRARLAVVAFAAVAFLAFAVGLVARFDSGGRHGTGISTPLDTIATTVPSAPPSSATTNTSTAASTTTTQVGVPLASVDWAAVTYPITPQCGTLFNPPVTVRQVDYAAPAPGVQLAVVMVRCTSGAGTPPDALYFYDGATTTDSPHLAGTLVRVSDGWQAQGSFSIEAATIDLRVGGFSSDSVPNCCPDVHTSLDWSWTGSGYELTSTVPGHVPGPAFGGY